ncbi:MAG: elongation factor Ts [Gammaproteobacteria bacterium]|nr:elongation factor Ts [Gammaproteobacteria bacterium]
MTKSIYSVRILCFAIMAFLIIRTASAEPTTATFEITFSSLWSDQTHPKEFPPNPHFSEFTGVIHNGLVSFWTPGMLATEGVKNVAERGREDKFLEETSRAIESGAASSGFEIDGFYQEETPSVKVVVSASHQHTLLSVITMLAPSPDWFTGVHDLELRPSGEWITSKVLQTYTYDAGTDSGLSYESRNQPTEPPAPITRIEGEPLAYQGEVRPTLNIRIDRID